jgi:hypothetical protein
MIFYGLSSMSLSQSHNLDHEMTLVFFSDHFLKLILFSIPSLNIWFMRGQVLSFFSFILHGIISISQYGSRI